MVDHRDVVSRYVNVELDSVNANFDRALKRRNRVFGRLAIGAAMGDDLDAGLPGVNLTYIRVHGPSCWAAAGMATRATTHPRLPVHLIP